MGAQPAFIRGGPPQVGPTSLPASTGQVPSWDTDGTFEAWVTPLSSVSGVVELPTGDSLEMSNANGADTIRLRTIGASPNRGWVFTTNGVDRFFMNHDGLLQSTSLNTGAVTCSSILVFAANPTLQVRRVGAANTCRFVFQTSTTDDWYVGTKNAAADFFIETAMGTAIRCAKTGLGVIMPNLPTSDPVVAGQLWNDSGTLKVSAG